MSHDPPSDEARREAELRERWLFHAARISHGLSLEQLEQMPKGGVLELLESQRILTQYLDLIAHGQQVNGWTGEELEDARYRLVAMLRQWTAEEGQLPRTVLKSRVLDPFRMLARFAEGLAQAKDDEMYAILTLLGIKVQTEQDMALYREWADELTARYNQLRQGERGDGDGEQ